ncbi:MAG: DUF72 domain-containing protein [Bacteroidota bacterium]|nr:DUF72 domain-containing protein [Bacteroidota bacterium]
MENNNILHLFIGTSGWSYKHWAGIFYPENVKPAGYLEYYTTNFNSVELNSSFYHLPMKKTIAGWVSRTPEPFVFCPKMSRYVTHLKRLVNVEESLNLYFDVFEGMKARLGPVLIQLPPGLPFDKQLLNNFIGILTGKYSTYRFAIEARHKSWFTDDCFKLLGQYNIALVIADSGKRYPYYEVVTADFVYFRFHGHEQLYASDYSEQELQDYAGKIISWLKENHEVWAFFNNDYQGFAPKNAKRLNEIISEALNIV